MGKREFNVLIDVISGTIAKVFTHAEDGIATVELWRTLFRGGRNEAEMLSVIHSCLHFSGSCVAAVNRA